MDQNPEELTPVSWDDARIWSEYRLLSSHWYVVWQASIFATTLCIQVAISYFENNIYMLYLPQWKPYDILMIIVRGHKRPATTRTT